MRILLIGQCTLHWGRMEFGNIGNYYIIEPFIRELHEVFPGCEIRTTLQMSERFCNEEKLITLPMNLYYGWEEGELERALAECTAAQVYKETGILVYETEYIKEVLNADIVIDFSGDIWGDNANFLGEKRFLIGLLKDRTAQLLKKPTYMLAGSPGPFGDKSTLEFAKLVFSNFDLVTNREEYSIEVLKQHQFDLTNVKNYACPAFLFQAGEKGNTPKVSNVHARVSKNGKPVVGFILCGWNFLTGPFDKWPRAKEDFEIFAKAVEYVCSNLNCTVVLISHSNGFDPTAKEFELKHGRDYQTVKELYNILLQRGKSKDLYLVNEILDAWETKAFLGKLDMLVSGRIHGAVAGLSQYVPTVIIDYGHEPKAHKLKGFANEAGALEYLADPQIEDDLINKIEKCWREKPLVKKLLSKSINTAKNKAKMNFLAIKSDVCEKIKGNTKHI